MRLRRFVVLDDADCEDDDDDGELMELLCSAALDELSAEPMSPWTAWPLLLSARASLALRFFPLL